MRQEGWITRRQAEFFGALLEIRRTTGVNPTVGELAKACGVTSTAARDVLLVLERRGLIFRGERRREIEIKTSAAFVWIGARTDEGRQEAAP